MNCYCYRLIAVVSKVQHNVVANTELQKHTPERENISYLKAKSTPLRHLHTNHPTLLILIKSYSWSLKSQTCDGNPAKMPTDTVLPVCRAHPNSSSWLLVSIPGTPKLHGFLVALQLCPGHGLHSAGPSPCYQVCTQCLVLRLLQHHQRWILSVYTTTVTSLLAPPHIRPSCEGRWEITHHLGLMERIWSFTYRPPSRGPSHPPHWRLSTHRHFRFGERRAAQACPISPPWTAKQAVYLIAADPLNPLRTGGPGMAGATARKQKPRQHWVHAEFIWLSFIHMYRGSSGFNNRNKYSSRFHLGKSSLARSTIESSATPLVWTAVWFLQCK